MPKEKTREKKSRHFTCSRCLKPSEFSIKYSGSVPQTITFPTSDDLNDHLQAKHGSAMYKCTARGCLGKGQTLRRFQKSGGLTDHMKLSHGPDTIFSCPISDCTFAPDVLDVVAVHVHWAHSDHPAEPSGVTCFDLASERARGLINAASWMYFRCPVWNCGQVLHSGYQRVSAHLRGHSAFELDQVQDKLTQDGYETVSSLTAAGADDAAHDITLHIRCPACEIMCENDTEFRRHIEAAHMLAQSPETMEHFEQWRKDVTPWITKVNAKRVARRLCWLSMAIEHSSHYGSHPRRCSYPSCSFQISSPGDEHPDFLRPAEDIGTELFPYRMKILRHWPDFLTHSMFQQQA
jgi:hypothetical protein